MDGQMIEDSSVSVPLQTVSNKEPKNNILKIILLSTLGIIVASGLLYTGIQISKKSPQVLLPSTPTPKVKPTEVLPTSIPIIYWSSLEKESKNSLGFSIVLPTGWEGIVFEDNVYLGPKTELGNLENMIRKGGGGSFCPAPVQITKSSFSSVEFPFYKCIEELNMNNIRSEITIDGNKAVKCLSVAKTASEAFDVGDKQIRVSIHKGNNFYEINMCNKYLQFEEQLDQILSTFKFSEATSEMSNWNSYSNKKYKFEFKYPFIDENFQDTEESKRDLETIFAKQFGKE